VWDFLGSAVKNIARLAPAIIPFFLAGHAPTQAAVAMNPGLMKTLKISALPVSPSQGASVALPFMMQGKVGIWNMSTRRHKSGSFILSMQGCDYLAPVTSTSGAGVAAGAVVQQFQLQPGSGVLANTRLGQFSVLYEKFRFKSLEIVYQPGCPSSTAGQLAGYVDTDPVDPANQTGAAAIQRAIAHVGSDVFSVWGVGAMHAAIDRSQDFFSEPDGSDIRFTSPGVFTLVASMTLPNNTPLGDLFIIYDIECMIPQTPGVTSAVGAVIQVIQNAPTAPTGANIWGTVDPNTAVNLASSMFWLTKFDGTKWLFYLIPVGSYKIIFTATGTGLSAPVIGGSGVVTIGGAASVVNSGATGFQATCIMTVTGDDSVATLGSLYVSCTATTIATVSLSAFAVNPGIALSSTDPDRVRTPTSVGLPKEPRMMTLQDYERLIQRMSMQVASLSTQVRQISGSTVTTATPLSRVDSSSPPAQPLLPANTVTSFAGTGSPMEFRCMGCDQSVTTQNLFTHQCVRRV
jgi:hypothetical protein